MKKAFTMIELIFVIVIIGILASVAIPKLQSLKDDAIASSCEYDVKQLLTEISTRYEATQTYAIWSNLKLEDNITNINLNIGTNGSGIANGNEVVDGNTISYHCDGLKIVDIKPAKNISTGNYEIKIEIVDTPANPAALSAANALEKQYSGLSKVFKM